MAHIYCRVEGIKGESQDEKHKDWFELTSFHHSVNQPVSAASRTGGRTAGRAEWQDVVIQKVIDKATPELLILCATGKHIAKIDIEFVTEAGKKHTFMKYILKDCIISSSTASGSTAENDVRPSEVIAISYGKISFSNIPINEKGAPQPAIKRGYDLAANKPVS